MAVLLDPKNTPPYTDGQEALPQTDRTDGQEALPQTDCPKRTAPNGSDGGLGDARGEGNGKAKATARPCLRGAYQEERVYMHVEVGCVGGPTQPPSVKLGRRRTFAHTVIPRLYCDVRSAQEHQARLPAVARPFL